MRENSVARWLCYLWIAIAVTLWMTIGDGNITMFLGITVPALTAALFVHQIRGGDFWALLIFTWSIPTAFFFTQVLNPDSNSGHSAPSACLVLPSLTIHFHHWLKALVMTLLHLPVVKVARMPNSAKRRHALHCYARWVIKLAMSYIVVAVFIAAVYPWNTSLWADMSGHGLYLLLLGFVCLGGHPQSRWFWRYIAFSLGITLGVQINGDHGVIRGALRADFQPLVFIHTEVDPLCPVPPQK